MRSSARSAPRTTAARRSAKSSGKNNAMFGEIGSLLVQTVFGLFVFVVLLRFWMQVLRGPFRNPVGPFVPALSNWIVLPVRRVIPGVLGFDLATVLIAWFAEALMLFLLLWLHGGSLGGSPG